jgi:hypothetical protein
MPPIETLLNRSWADLALAPPIPGPLPIPKDLGGDFYASWRDKGITVIFGEPDTINTIQLYGPDHQKFDSFTEPMPHGITFMMSRQDIRQRLGQPLRSHDAGTVPVLGATAPWDLYAMDGYTMHLEYSPTSGLIQLVSLATST